MKRVVVLGGGITGLTAAYYLKKRFAEQGISAAITLVEQAERLGGKVNTLRREGFHIEKGPDSFLARKLPIIELTRELGLEGELVPTNPEAKRTFILSENKLHRMPPGLVLGIPTEVAPFLKTGLISWKGKARAALDLALPKRRGTEDESLGGFLERRLGREVLDRIAEPLLAGIYAGDTHHLSLQATFPQFREVEQKHRSIILGMIAGKRKPKPTAPAPEKQQPNPLPPALRSSLFLSYRRGLETLTEALAAALDGVDVRSGVKAESVERGEHGVKVKLAGGETIEAEAVIATLPLYTLGELFGALPAVQELAKVPYVSVANVILAFERAAIDHPLDGSGFVIPRREGRFITACTWTSSKWKHTAPDGRVLLRCYVGRSGEEGWTKLSDEQIVDKVRADVRDLMGIAAKPMFAEVTRLFRSMPQYPVGHLDRIRSARAEMAAQLPGVWMTGAGFHGVGLPDCIKQARDTAEEVVAFLEKRT